MITLKFLKPADYTPYTGNIPAKWLNHSFDNLDFTGKDVLKDFVCSYLKSMSSDGRRCLLLHTSGTFAYALTIALYKVVASYLAVDTYFFMDWLPYLSRIKAQYGKGDDLVVQDLYGKSYVFIFDLSLSTDEARSTFQLIVNYLLSVNASMYICTKHTKAELTTYLGTMWTTINNSCVLVTVND